MLLVTGLLVGLVTFPGVIIHEYAHKKSCDLFGVPVYEAVYFRTGNPAGYVIHEPPRTYRQTFAISVAPFAVNTVVALAVLCVVAMFWGRPGPIWLDTARMSGWGWALLWLGLSVGIHAFPSTGDAKQIWHRSVEEWRSAPLTLLGLPFVALIYVANMLRVVWFDGIYALALLGLALYVTGILVA